MEVSEFRKVNGTRAFHGWRLRPRRSSHRQPARKRVYAGTDPHIDDLDLRRRWLTSEGLEIASLEGLQQTWPRVRCIRAGGQRHDKFGGLANVANVGEADDGGRVGIRHRG